MLRQDIWALCEEARTALIDEGPESGEQEKVAEDTTPTIQDRIDYVDEVLEGAGRNEGKIAIAKVLAFTDLLSGGGRPGGLTRNGEDRR